MKKYIIIIFFTTAFHSLYAQNSAEADKLIYAGNNFYREKQYEQAVAQYQQALDLDAGNSTALNNLASALYRLGKQDEAVKLFNELAVHTRGKELRSRSYYNKGAVQSRQKKLEESIESYKSTLRLDPNDKEARENLQKALLELKKKNPKQDPDQNKSQQQQQQQKKSQSKMSPKEAEQRLKLLEQKEKEVQERLQKERAKSGGGTGKDW